MEEIRRSLREVAQAIERLNQAFEKHSDTLRQTGDLDLLKQWINATQAMRDSGHLYLTWANHYVHSTGKEAQDLEGEDSNPFLDEQDRISI